MTAKIFEKTSRENLLPKISESVLQTKSRVNDSCWLNTLIKKAGKIILRVPLFI
jgi:hypothetical protein